jgi:hypothetical protein
MVGSGRPHCAVAMNLCVVRSGMAIYLAVRCHDNATHVIRLKQVDYESDPWFETLPPKFEAECNRMRQFSMVRRSSGESVEGSTSHWNFPDASQLPMNLPSCSNTVLM